MFVEIDSWESWNSALKDFVMATGACLLVRAICRPGGMHGIVPRVLAAYLPKADHAAESSSIASSTLSQLCIAVCSHKVLS